MLGTFEDSSMTGKSEAARVPDIIYNVLKHFNPNSAPVEAVTYKNNVTHSFDVTTSECMSLITHSMVIYIMLHLQQMKMTP